MWTHLRIRTQLSLIQLIVGGVTISIVSTIFIISFSWIINKYVVISTQLQVREYYSNTNNIMKWQVESAKQILFRSKQQILKGNQLYQFMQKSDQFFIEQPYDCLLDSQYISSSEFQSLFCYGIFGYLEQPKTLKLQLAKNLSSLLTQVLPMIDMDIDLLFATSSNEQYYSIWPGDPYPNYVPHKREWYSQHIRKASSGEETYFSSPYIIYPWLLYMITQTTNMTGISGELDGVFGSDFNLSLIKTFQQNYETFKFSIIDQDGMLLMSQYDIQDQQYIYNESLTGLDYESYLQIINLSNGNQFQSNCDSLIQNQLCRHNSLFDGDEIILATNLIRPDLIIVVQSNFENKKQELKLQNDKFQSEFQATANFSLIESIIICVSSIIINSIIIYYVFDPIHNILKFTNEFIHKDDLSCGNYFNWRVNEFISNKRVNEDLYRLLRAFNRIRKGYKYNQYIQKQKKKRIERIKYPKHDIIGKFKIENIYDNYPYDNFISRSTIFQLQRNIIIIRQNEKKFYESTK